MVIAAIGVLLINPKANNAGGTRKLSWVYFNTKFTFWLLCKPDGTLREGSKFLLLALFLGIAVLVWVVPIKP